MNQALPVNILNIFFVILFIGVFLNAVLLFNFGKNCKGVYTDVSWGLFDVLIVVLFFIAIQIAVVAIPTMLIYEKIGVSKEIIDTYIVELLSIGFLVFLLRKRYAVNWENIGFKKFGNVSACIWTVIYYLSSIPWILLGAVLTAFLAAKLNIPLEPQQITKMLLGDQNLYEFALTCLLVMVLAPIGEELFFRGFVYPVMKRRMGLRFAIILNALFFSALHYNVYAFLPVFVIGIFLVLLYEKTDNIISVILFHITFNSMSLLVLKIAYGMAIK